MLSSNNLDVQWDGIGEISIVTFNKRRTIRKILHIDSTNVN